MRLFSNLTDTLTLINTNARSLCSKIESLTDCYEELKVDVGIITETWFKNGPELEQNLSDLELGAGLGSLVLNRDPNPLTGVSHGGVAIICRKRIGTFKKIDFPNPDKFEVLPATGSIRGSSRKIAVIAAYIPPNYTVPNGSACLDHIENLIEHVKRQYRDPFIVLAGDFNQWSAGGAVAEYPDVSEIDVEPTSGDHRIDRLFCNMSRSVVESGTVPPLETEHSVSDHKIAYVTFKLKRQEPFEWVNYSYRLCTQEAREDFGRWIVQQD